MIHIYLSSLGFGRQFDKFLASLPKFPKMAYIVAAKDHEDTQEWEKLNNQKLLEFEKLGISSEILHLKDFFGKSGELQEKLEVYDFIWIRGGNVFVLSRAMQLCGFKQALLGRAQSKKKIAYGGWSAGACILTKDLHGAEFVDDPSIDPYNTFLNPYEGLGILEYSIIPHAGSPDVREYTEFLEKSSTPFLLLHDGEDLMINISL